MARDFSPEDLKEWSKDPRGAAFWEEIRDLFSMGVSKLRSAARAGDHTAEAYTAGQIDTLEEVLQLPELMLQNRAQEEKEKATQNVEEP